MRGIFSKPQLERYVRKHEKYKEQGLPDWMESIEQLLTNMRYPAIAAHLHAGNYQAARAEIKPKAEQT